MSLNHYASTAGAAFGGLQECVVKSITCSTGGISFYNSFQSATGSPLSFNEENYVFTSQATGPWIATTGVFQSVLSRVGNHVQLKTTAVMSGTQGIVLAPIDVVTAIPSRFRPTATIDLPVSVINASLLDRGNLRVTSAGLLHINGPLPVVGFTGASNCGIGITSTSWTV